MRIEFNTLCRWADHAEGGRFVSMGCAGITGFRVEQFPANVPVSLYYVLRIGYPPEESNRQYVITLVLKDPDGKVAVAFGDSTVHPKLDEGSREATSTTILGFFGLTVPKAGRYFVEASCEGKVIAECPLWVDLLPKA